MKTILIIFCKKIFEAFSELFSSISMLMKKEKVIVEQPKKENKVVSFKERIEDAKNKREIFNREMTEKFIKQTVKHFIFECERVFSKNPETKEFDFFVYLYIEDRIPIIFNPSDLLNLKEFIKSSCFLTEENFKVTKEVVNHRDALKFTVKNPLL